MSETENGRKKREPKLPIELRYDEKVHDLVGRVVRVYPNQAQVKLYHRWQAAVRKQHNYVLDRVFAEHEATGKFNVKSSQLLALGVEFRKLEGNEWILEAPTRMLNPALEKDLKKGFERFFDKTIPKRAKVKKGSQRPKKYKIMFAPGIPKFKSWRDRQTGLYLNSEFVKVDTAKETITLGKGGGTMHYRGGDMPPGFVKFYSGRLKESAGKWYVSMVCMCLKQPVASLGEHEFVGVDAGVKTLATVFDGENITIGENPKAYYAAEKKLKRLQRSLSRGEKDSKRSKRKKLLLARAHERVANIRKDNAHKVSKMIIDKGQNIVVESLNVTGMIRSKIQSKSISDAGMGTLLQFINYKSAKYGRNLIAVGQFYPSSKTCAECGEVNKELKRADMFVCPSCGYKAQRDFNAARNLYKYGSAVHARTGSDLK